MTVIAPTNAPNTTAPTASVWSNPSTTASESQSFAEPSDSAAAMMTRPMSRVRGSRQAPSAAPRRTRRERGCSTAAASTPSGPASPRRASTRGRGSVAWTNIGMLTRRQTVATTAVPTNCTRTGTSPAAHAAPTSEPTTAPMLKAAWNCGRIVRPVRRSTLALSTFMGTLPRENATPFRKMPAASSGTEPVAGPTPRSTSAAAKKPVEASMAARPPKRLTIGPASVTVTSAPTAPASSTKPRSLGVMPRASRTEGMRASQLDMVMPLSRKIPRRDQRARERPGSSAGRIDSIPASGVAFETIRDMVTSLRVVWPRRQTPFPCVTADPSSSRRPAEGQR
ncbi:hypothetical protein OERS_39490 [Oerskovia enterophila]|uniref:Uncharacterized protein n=1 Tax=Oerskovia enterophila TaxID=43678 RepID=A0ABX2XYJ2_9CELL|nr:hypothetical protein OERS_39490 [Oerskovia enterophila]